ncbi:SDR family oxidoreductase [Halapricum hydrolyticum]|uniref:SDR family oxidoreductase n=1 Tax=Halapricum hydrolyticum TaxID=2979991 RepID=A0AAE3LF52_9EURY|nr:SDR family oxidoreductase [Halapricum hydrolyticum]MCU4718320.1 SDR family oxidoreductase [Halapricum hydrolyticum]MCU4727232.1 SDR family oxidoreductase [Halapricum hydrolyticum]
MSVEFDFSDSVMLVTGAGGALGSAIATAFAESGATVAAVDIVEPESEDFLLDPDHERIDVYQADFVDETQVSETVEAVVADHGGIDYLANVAGTWRGGTPIDETDVETFEFLMDVNLKTMFLASKHALSHLREGVGAIVSVSARSALEGGEGDGVYRASKAGVKLLTETLAEENEEGVRANAVLPSVIDTPMNREMMPDADHDAWVEPREIAQVVQFLCSDAAGVTSGASIPVYGEA